MIDRLDLDSALTRVREEVFMAIARGEVTGHFVSSDAPDVGNNDEAILDAIRVAASAVRYALELQAATGQSLAEKIN